MPSTWRRDHHNEHRFAANDDDDSDEDDGAEELGAMDTMNDRRRAALSLDTGRVHRDDESRLSRDLEQGFRDDSEDDSPERHDRR